MCLLTAIGLSPGGSSTVHIYKQTIYRTIQNKQYILYIFFWVFPRRQIVVGRRFGTLCQFHLQRLDERSANYNLTPGKYPKEYIQYSNHGESLKSRVYVFYTR